MLSSALVDFSRFRKPAVAIVVASILLAGGLPNESDPLNFVHWSGANGLRFEGQSQVVSESSLWLEGDAFTLEVWLSPDQPLGIGNQEILSFVDGSGVRPLVLGQWSKGFLLRKPGPEPRRTAESRSLRPPRGSFSPSSGHRGAS